MRPVFGRVGAGIAVTAALVVGASACGSSDARLDHQKLEGKIRAELEQSNRVKDVHCPDEVKSERGTTFECTATVEGTQQVIDGTVRAKRNVSIKLRA